MSGPGGAFDPKRVPTRFPVLEVLAARWSPRSFLDRMPEPELLGSVLEAARLAPSAHNTQPARFLVARAGHGDGHARLCACLSPHNQVWAPAAPVLVLACVMRERLSQVDARMVPYPHAMHDLGLAVMSAIVQAQALGLHAHPIAGFEPDLARTAFHVPDLYEPGLVLALGYAGPSDALPADLQAKERGPRARRALEEVVFEGDWGQVPDLLARRVGR